MNKILLHATAMEENDECKENLIILGWMKLFLFYFIFQLIVSVSKCTSSICIKRENINLLNGRQKLNDVYPGVTYV